MYFGFYNTCCCGYSNPFQNFFLPFRMMNPCSYPVFFNDFSIGRTMPFFRNPFSIFQPYNNWNNTVNNNDYNYSRTEDNAKDDLDCTLKVVARDEGKVLEPAKTELVSKPENVKKVEPQTSNDIYVGGVKYNKNKGELLAKNIVDGLPNDRDPANPLCAKYVKLATANSGFGPYVYGPNGAGCKEVYRANPNFKEVNIKGKDFATLPAGCIITYAANEKVTDKNGYSSQIGDDGHVLVTLGDGRGCSDIIEDEILQSDTAHVFVPV